VARLEAVSRSPIYTDFSQALVGASSIRAYQDEERFIKRLESCVDENSIAGIVQQLSSNWLALRLDFLGSTISFFIALVAVASGSFIPPGFLALGLSYSFQVTTYMKFAVRMIATFEAQVQQNVTFHSLLFCVILF
jgi:ATP-binding cassette subfamily C (CFTR/MRP) protein 1